MTYDVLFFGAGLSCIGAAYHLQKRHPQKTYAILEAREDLRGAEPQQAHLGADLSAVAGLPGAFTRRSSMRSL